MAEPVKRGDKYRHLIMVDGQRLSGTFDTKKEARAWESKMRLEAKEDAEAGVVRRKKHTLTEAVDRYVTTISPLKKGAVKRETLLLNAFIRYFPKRNLEDITHDDIARWRDDSLKRVCGSTVNRYSNLYGNLFAVAMREWGWITVNPFSGVKRPKENPPRDEVWRWQEIKRMVREGQARGGKYLEVTQAFRISLHTAMRLKEALAAPGGFRPDSGIIIIGDRKEAHNAKAVKIPLIARSVRFMRTMPSSFRVQPNEASTLFCKLRRQVGLEDRLQFKDARATALTLLSKRVEVGVLKRISRHKDFNILMDVYYRETAEEIARRH